MRTVAITCIALALAGASPAHAQAAPVASDNGMRIAHTSAGTWGTSPTQGLASSDETADPTTPGSWVPIPPPPARAGALAIYDEQGDRMVVFGGGSGLGYVRDVWGLPLSNPQSWTYEPFLGTQPAPRTSASGAYDPLRQRVLVYGGNDASSSLDDLWALDLSSTATWTRLAPTGSSPGGGSGFTAIYDPNRDRMLFVGGATASGPCPTPEVWQLTLTATPAWSKLTVAGAPPSGRAGTVVAYDSIRDRLLLFGGSSGLCIQPSVYYNDLWSLSLAGTPTWTQLMPSGTAPTGRAYGRAVYDAASDRLFLLNGSGSDALWAVAFAGGPAWTRLSPAGSWPAPSGQAVIRDPVRGELVVFGGVGGGYSNSTRSLSLASPTAWFDPAPNGGAPAPMSGPKGIYDPVSDRLMIWSGSDVTQLSMVFPPTWAHVAVVGSAPTSVREGSVIYDPARRHMVVFGGYDSNNALQSVAWFMTMSGAPGWNGTPEWGVYTALAPVPRAAHSAIYDPNRDAMLVFGGTGGGSYRNDVVGLDLGTGAWSTMTTGGTPPHARFDHSAVYDPVGNRMLVFGGAYWDGVWRVYNDVWALSLAGGTPTWSLISPTGSPPRARFNHTAVYDPAFDRMLVYGGSVDSVNFVGDVWELQLSGVPAWLRIAPSGDSLGKRTKHASVFDGLRNRMVVFGGIGSASGYNGSSLNDAWALYHGTTTAVDQPHRVPPQLALRAAPNPSRGPIRVNFAIPSSGEMVLQVFDIAGRRVRTLLATTCEAGERAISWDGLTDAGVRTRPGLYLLRLKTQTSSGSIRIALLP